MADPFTLHWNSGVVPPLKGTALNVTGVPEQTVVEVADTVTLTGRTGFTIIPIGPEVAGLPETQASLDVSTHVTWSLFAGL
jgi:hypothetical protein